MKEEESNQINNTNNEYKYYKEATVIKKCFSTEFDLSFDSIKNSLVTAGFFGKIKGFYQWKFKNVDLSVPTDMIQLERQLPINEKPEFKCSQKGKICYTWIGHSTAVINIEGDINILIDPVFSNRCSPFQFAGPQRFRKPACTIQNLPQIDLVLVSHDHYDHLDEHSLRELEGRESPPQFVAGLNSRDVIKTKDANRMHELNWTQKKRINLKNNQYVDVTFVPVCHWGRRWIFDFNQRLWGGFVIETSKGKKIFYSGDTGYCEIFKEIGDKFGPFDLCILPIGAYKPRQLLRQQHVNPEQAVKIHKQLRSKKSVGVHWGTFPLGSQHWHAARDDLAKAVRQNSLKQDEFITIGHGNSFQI